MSTDLLDIATALDAFEHLDEYERAIIYSAYDLAPVDAPDLFNMNTLYFTTPAFSAWEKARQVILAPTGNRWAVDLLEASGFSSSITKAEIVKALERGARLVKG